MIFILYLFGFSSFLSSALLPTYSLFIELPDLSLFRVSFLVELLSFLQFFSRFVLYFKPLEDSSENFLFFYWI
jgi:hypothetical protein